jgi:hypothetical protein
VALDTARGLCAVRLEDVAELTGAAHHCTECAWLVGRWHAERIEAIPHVVGRELGLHSRDVRDRILGSDHPLGGGVALHALDRLVARGLRLSSTLCEQFELVVLGCTLEVGAHGVGSI